MVGGGADKDHKFVARILSQIAAGPTTIHAVGDQVRDADLHRGLRPEPAPSHRHSEVYGLYHMVCRRRWLAGSTWHGRILELLGRDDITVRPVDSAYFAETFFAPRPRSEMMRNYKLELAGIELMRPWPEALRAYLDRTVEGPSADLLVRPAGP